MFKIGKIVDQIWSGIHGAKVLVAELTGRNPNVFLRAGALAHALQKPVRSRVIQRRRRFHLMFKHIRVIYYNVLRSFLGGRKTDRQRSAENVLSALQNPGDADS